MVTELKPTTVTLTDLISRFLASRQRLNRSPNTLAYYRIVLANFQWYARTNKWPQELEALTRGHLREFLDYVSSESFRWPSTSSLAHWTGWSTHRRAIMVGDGGSSLR